MALVFSILYPSCILSKNAEGHHLRGTTLPEALRGHLLRMRVLRGLWCRCLIEGSVRLCGVLHVSTGFSEVSPCSDPMLKVPSGAVGIMLLNKHFFGSPLFVTLEKVVGKIKPCLVLCL